MARPMTFLSSTESSKVVGFSPGSVRMNRRDRRAAIRKSQVIPDSPEASTSAALYEAGLRPMRAGKLSRRADLHAHRHRSLPYAERPEPGSIEGQR